ncbi:hypothetical protein MJL79_29280, partial [Salmonella enterica subsp. enterica serovar Montevideo]|nr:hypothetical protein [Salmonella enterica subsp. enterica serovar Montevideo]
MPVILWMLSVRRENPAKALCRHSLFQLLCVAGDWSRALHQLQLCARMEANYTQ